MNSLSRLLRIRLPPCHLLGSRYRRRETTPATEDVVAREAEAFNLLTQVKSARISIDPHQFELRHLTRAKEGDPFVELPSNELKKIIKEFKFSISVVQSDGDLPVFKLNKKSEGPTKADRKTGIKLAQGERGKTLTMKSQIDDHMLGVRVKQAEAFLDANYVVTVLVRVLRSKPPGPQTDEEKEEHDRLMKMMYKIEAQRFVDAFSQIPSATVRLLERPRLTEIAILVKRTKQS